MAVNKKEARLRRASKTRHHLKELRQVSICVNKTPRHMYAYLINEDRSKTILSVATIEADVRSQLKQTGGIEAAKLVGKVLAERALAKGITEVAFDRSGFPYHGRVKALAEAAREAGLKF